MDAAVALMPDFRQGGGGEPSFAEKFIISSSNLEAGGCDHNRCFRLRFYVCACCHVSEFSKQCGVCVFLHKVGFFLQNNVQGDHCKVHCHGSACTRKRTEMGSLGHRTSFLHRTENPFMRHKHTMRKMILQNEPVQKASVLHCCIHSALLACFS